MLKLNKYFLFLFLIPICMFFAQNEQSIQLNGGVLYPRSSSNGFSTFLNYNYSLNETVKLYVYSGYSSWDKFNVMYIEEFTPIQKKQYFTTYSSDNHIIIPLYLGSRVNFHTNKLFTSFLEFEVGYSYFRYNSYKNNQVVNKDTGEILSYDVDKGSKQEVSKNLFGLGIGLGLSHSISQALDVILGYKLNSNFNSGDFGLFSAKGTYYTLYGGLGFNI